MGGTSESDVEGEVSSDMEAEGAGEVGTMPSVVVGREPTGQTESDGKGRCACRS